MRKSLCALFSLATIALSWGEPTPSVMWTEPHCATAAGAFCEMQIPNQVCPSPDADGWSQVATRLGSRTVVVGGDDCRSLLLWLAARRDIGGAFLIQPDLEGLPENWSAASPPLVVITSEETPPEWLTQASQRGIRIQHRSLPGRGGELSEHNSPMQKALRRFLAEVDGLAPQGLKGVPFVQSPNWDVRNLETKIDTVVVHATVINTLEGTRRAFMDDKDRRVSAHYVVDRDGTILQMVDERMTAWHAGVSELDGRRGVNDFSLGVELVNLNDGQDPYPEAQMLALARIIRDLRRRWDIPDGRIVSHAAIARPEGRKSDPKGFDFNHLLEILRR